MRKPKWLLDAADTAPAPGEQPRVLLYDIETTPLASYNWGVYKQNAISVIRPWYVLCGAYKWLGSDDVHWFGINQDPGFKPDNGYQKPRPNVDRYAVARLWHLFDQADVLVAHNGDKFDQKKTQARFITHKLPPPSPTKSIDTLKEVRKHAAFSSNRLNDLAQQLSLGLKETHSGMATWFGCMAGEPVAWADMERYNRQDIVPLEGLYRELLPWIGGPGKANPAVNAAAFATLGDDGRPVACPKVGCRGTELSSRGHSISAAGLRHRRWQCKKCGGWCQSRYQDREDHRPIVK